MPTLSASARSECPECGDTIEPGDEVCFVNDEAVCAVHEEWDYDNEPYGPNGPLHDRREERDGLR